MPQALVPIDTPLSIICKHIPRQSDIDKIVKNIETRVIHSLELPILCQVFSIVNSAILCTNAGCVLVYIPSLVGGAHVRATVL